jgi:hypothetical protein
MAKLDLNTIVVDFEALAATDERWDFDVLAFKMLARAGQMTSQLVASVARATPPQGLTLDEAVLGGLLVRQMKLVRALFDSTQADASEAHLVLSRCVGETALTLSWLSEHGSAEHLRRFRADSFAHWRREVERMRRAEGREDEVSQTTRALVEAEVEGELSAAGLTWEDVPPRTNSWGPDLRQRCEPLDRGWVYDTLFASHSAYVHPSWHEIRTFHLATENGRLVLDPTYGGIAPIAGYIITRLVAEACLSASRRLPCDLESADVEARVSATVEATQALAVEFAEFSARGGLDDALGRHRE